MPIKTVTLLILVALTGLAHAQPIQLVRTPENGLQPQAAIDAQGRIHLIYFKGEPRAGDVYYAYMAPGDSAFSNPLRVNSSEQSAIAIGTVRGAHLALGKNGRPHVAWMDAGEGHKGMIYTRLDSAGTSFESQRNITQFALGLDGGGSVAADELGHVWVSWHAGQDGEATRRIWVAQSDDEGASFAAEERANPLEQGACGCCGMRSFGHKGILYVLYRSASEIVHRDMTLLSGADISAMEQQKIHPWELSTCPMSTSYLSADPSGALLAWQTERQVYYAHRNGPVFSPPGDAGNRKHPVAVANARGQVLLVWTEGTGWNQGGDLAWQLFDTDNQPIGALERRDDAIAIWDTAAAVAMPDGRFVIIY